MPVVLGEIIMAFWVGKKASWPFFRVIVFLSLEFSEV